MTIDPRKAIMQGDAGFDKRWEEWITDIPKENDPVKLIKMYTIARHWWHAGIVRGVTLMTREDEQR